jgi:ABC-2 type transport system permease protein
MQIVWRFDVAMTMAATVGRIVAARILWQAIFAGKAQVGGFTFEAMLSYYIVCSIISSIDFSHQICGEVSWLIRDGKFSGHMVTPMNPMGFFGSMAAGESAFHLGFSIAAAAACAAAFRMADIGAMGGVGGMGGMGAILTAGTARMLLAAAMIPLGLAFMAIYQYIIGILAFKFLDIGFLEHVLGSVNGFATGAYVPLSLLPGPVLGALRFLPFTHVVYTPSMLITGQIGAREGLLGLASLAAWLVAAYAIAQFAYGKLRISYDGVGI